jgi:hypothetical protein
LIIWLIFFLFLLTKPSFSPLFAWSQLDTSATSDSVSAVSEGYQVNYCWILKLLCERRIFKLLNLCGNQLISIPELLMSVFLLFLVKILQQLNLNQIFNEDFYLPIYLPSSMLPPYNIKNGSALNTEQFSSQAIDTVAVLSGNWYTL